MTSFIKFIKSNKVQIKQRSYTSMRYKILLILFIITTALSIHAFDYIEYYFRIPYSHKSTIVEVNKHCSVDNFDEKYIYAYANPQQFVDISQKYEMLQLLINPSKSMELPLASTLNEMRNWDSYPDYPTYIAMMEQFSLQYPNLCTIENIGTSVDNRDILVAKISNNVALDEAQPKFFYTGQMHGDELVCYVLFLRLIDYLLINYEVDPEITEILNTTQIYINPLSNPDGLYTNNDNTILGATRYNANGVDLNRNFPTPTGIDHPDGNSWQPETIAMMDFATQHKFVMSANTHSGAVVVNYPWDIWQRRHPDDNWFQYVCRMYADSVQENAPYPYMTDFDNGITNGYDWYSTTGSRQDWFTYFNQTREITLELSFDKILPTNQLQAHWDYNYQAMIKWLREVNYGVKGVISNEVGEPLVAKIEILNHDLASDKSYVFSSELHGDYYRPLSPGTYAVRISAEGYEAQTIEDVTVENSRSVEVNATLMNSTLTSFSGSVYTNETMPVAGATVILTDFLTYETTTDASGFFNIATIYSGMYDLRINAEGYQPYTSTIYVSEETGPVNINLNESYAESFEHSLPGEWFSTTSRSWFRDGNNAYDGNYSLRSGNISGNQTSNIIVESNFNSEGTISFYYKVSSEVGYDFLRFYINDQLQEAWSGEIDWSYAEFATPTGNNSYKWEYKKDRYVNGGLDSAWIDYVLIPQSTDNADWEIVNEVKHQLSCYPNPFNPELNLSFYQTEKSPVEQIDIYNLKGQKIKQINDISKTSGFQTIVWDGKDNSNKSVASGIYFIKMKSEAITATQKVVLLK